MTVKLIILLISLIAIHHAETQFVFAFSWLGGFCNGGCVEGKYKLWDHQSFTIHGLWSQQRFQPRTFGNFDLDLINSNKTLVQKLMNYMPPKSKSHQSDVFLWKHQWESQISADGHGHDYGHYRLKVHGDEYAGLSETEVKVKIQKDYYNEILTFYESFPEVRKIKSSKLNLSELANIFNRKPAEIRVSCSLQSETRCQVSEVQICTIFRKNGIESVSCRDEDNQTPKQKKKNDKFQARNLKRQYVLPDWNSGWLNNYKNADKSKVIQVDEELQKFLSLSKDEREALQAKQESVMTLNADEFSEQAEQDSVEEDNEQRDEQKSESSTDQSETL